MYGTRVVFCQMLVGSAGFADMSLAATACPGIVSTVEAVSVPRLNADDSAGPAAITARAGIASRQQRPSTRMPLQQEFSSRACIVVSLLGQSDCRCLARTHSCVTLTRR